MSAVQPASAARHPTWSVSHDCVDCPMTECFPGFNFFRAFFNSRPENTLVGTVSWAARFDFTGQFFKQVHVLCSHDSAVNPLIKSSCSRNDGTIEQRVFSGKSDYDVRRPFSFNILSSAQSMKAFVFAHLGRLPQFSR